MGRSRRGKKLLPMGLDLFSYLAGSSKIHRKILISCIFYWSSRHEKHCQMLKYYLGYSTTIETYCVTQAFPNLEKLTVNHPKFVTMDNNQIWPENLTKLTIYNTNTEVLPLINGSRIQSLTIQNWKNLRHNTYIRTVRPKYLFSFDTFDSFLAGLGRNWVYFASCSDKKTHKKASTSLTKQAKSAKSLLY